MKGERNKQVAVVVIVTKRKRKSKEKVSSLILNVLWSGVYLYNGLTLNSKSLNY